MTVLSLPASAAGTDSSLSDITAIVTAFLGFLTVIAAIVAIVYAKKSADAAKEAVAPLDSIADDTKKSLEDARRLRVVDLLARRAALLGQIVDTITTILYFHTELATSQFSGDPLKFFDNRYKQERKKLVIALKMLPSSMLPKCRAVADIEDFEDAFPDLEEAGSEADQELNLTLTELEEEARKTREGTLADPASLLDWLRRAGHSLVERFVLALLTNSGCDEAAKRFGTAADEGSDGVIRRDPQRPVRLYVQASQDDATVAVGQPALEKFAGRLRQARAEGGIFITTGRFTPAAVAYANEGGARIVLIDGRALRDLMVRRDIRCPAGRRPC